MIENDVLTKIYGEFPLNTLRHCFIFIKKRNCPGINPQLKNTKDMKKLGTVSGKWHAEDLKI
jgi:hypothetical protein